VSRRLATQHVREARDRLTSSGETKPAFKYELLRQYTQNRISASLVILLLVATVGFMSSVWSGVLAAGTWTVAVLITHAVIVTKCRQFLEKPACEISIRAWRLRFITLGLGSNSIKSAEQCTGLGLPIAKSLVDLHGGNFTLTSKLRIGTEVIVTFPPERVIAVTPPLSERAPPISSSTEPDLSSPEKRHVGRRPLFRVGT